jgi:hypothetical protein
MNRNRILHSITAIGSACAVLPCAALATDACGTVHTAYSKMLSSHTQQKVTNGGTVNVTAAFGDIVDDGSYSDTCAYVRDEKIDGQATAVWSERMASKAGAADALVWISKDTGATLRQDVSVDMGAKGKGSQSIRFVYVK